MTTINIFVQQTRQQTRQQKTMKEVKGLEWRCRRCKEEYTCRQCRGRYIEEEGVEWEYTDLTEDMETTPTTVYRYNNPIKDVKISEIRQQEYQRIPYNQLKNYNLACIYANKGYNGRWMVVGPIGTTTEPYLK